MIIPYEQLKELLGGTTIEDVIVRLEKRKIAYIKGKKNKPFTTEFALHCNMGLISPNQNHSPDPENIEIM